MSIELHYQFKKKTIDKYRFFQYNFLKQLGRIKIDFKFGRSNYSKLLLQSSIFVYNFK